MFKFIPIILQVPVPQPNPTPFYESLAFNYGVLGIFAVIMIVVIRYLWSFIKATINDLKAENKELRADIKDLHNKIDAINGKLIMIIEKEMNLSEKNVAVMDIIINNCKICQLQLQQQKGKHDEKS